MSLIDDITNKTYANIVEEVLSFVPDTVDKREGSIIFDATAAVSFAIAELYMDYLYVFLLDTNIETATGQALDNLALENGLTRYPATYAVKRGVFVDTSGNPMTIPIGSRFTTVNTNPILAYRAIAEYSSGGSVVAGSYLLQSETAGTIGNDYVGNLQPVAFMTNLQSAEIVGAPITPAQNEETDDELRERIIAKNRVESSNGNIQSYITYVTAIEGVGQVQVYPTPQGGGTVLLSVVDDSNNPISTDFQNTIKGLVDPANAQGEYGKGVGIAPIAALVNVTTPNAIAININAQVVLSQGVSLASVQQPIKDAITAYISIIRSEWAKGDELYQYSANIFLARIYTAILGVSGVENVTSVTINGNASDLALIENSTTQQMPAVGTVTITEA